MSLDLEFDTDPTQKAKRKRRERLADNRGGNDDCLTPRYIVDAVGPFGLDPCYGEPRPWPTASVMYDSNGLEAKWEGRVWLNPPYSEVAVWMRRMCVHRGGGIALVYNRSDTGWFDQCVFDRAHAMFYFSHRLGFYDNNGERIRTRKGDIATAGAPSVLVSYSAFDTQVIYRASRDGKITGNLRLNTKYEPLNLRL